jgi:Leucine-rich repeat (LRR) protein
MALDCSSSLGGFSGTHSRFKDNENISGLTISSSYFNEFPTKIFDNSPKEYLKIFDSGFGKVEKICDGKTKFLIINKSFLGGNFIEIKNCENLIHLIIENSNLRKISLDNLKFLTDLSLKSNEIDEIPQNFFNSMENLKNVQFGKNKISNLDGKIFAKNSKLEVVNFSENPIKFIGSEIFNFNRALTRVIFQKSGCINKQIVKASELEVLKREIREKCRN